MYATTKREVIEAAAKGHGCLGKAAPDEPVFILRAQDIHAADLVEKWAIWARTGGCTDGKVDHAFEIARQMRDWPNRKQPD